MLKKALVILYAVEALYLLVPWQYFINGRLLLNYNDGIVMWLGVPGFYTFARFITRYGATLWVRLGAMAWTLMWIVAAVVLIDNSHESELLLYLGSWVLIANCIAIVGPLGWSLRRHSLQPTEQSTPSAVTLGVASWLLPAAFVLALLSAEHMPWCGRTDRAIGTLFAPFVLLSPVLAMAGVLKGFVERRSERRWLSGAGIVLCAAFLGALASFVVLGSLTKY